MTARRERSVQSIRGLQAIRSSWSYAVTTISTPDLRAALCTKAVQADRLRLLAEVAPWFREVNFEEGRRTIYQWRQVHQVEQRFLICGRRRWMMDKCREAFKSCLGQEEAKISKTRPEGTAH